MVGVNDVRGEGLGGEARERLASVANLLAAHLGLVAEAAVLADEPVPAWLHAAGPGAAAWAEELRRSTGGRQPVPDLAAVGGAAAPGSQLAEVVDLRRWRPAGLARLWLPLARPSWLADEVRWWCRPGGPVRRWLARAGSRAARLGGTVKWLG